MPSAGRWPLAGRCSPSSHTSLILLARRADPHVAPRLRCFEELVEGLDKGLHLASAQLLDNRSDQCPAGSVDLGGEGASLLRQTDASDSPVLGIGPSPDALPP